MCLLIALWQVVEGAPLIIAANRDERYGRPATAITVLRAAPRMLGGRDLLAGGTWLAVNESGLVAGLTNRPAPQGRDLAKQSRGELPIALAAHADAAAAAAWAGASISPADYNPCWLLAGDRDSLHYLDITHGPRPAVRRLAPGIHVLENEPLHSESAKAAHVGLLVEQAISASHPAAPDLTRLAGALAAILRDHTTPAGASPGRPVLTSAACVHGEDYGTRSAMIVTVPSAGRPQILVADGPPCQAPMRPADDLWAVPPAELAGHGELTGRRDNREPGMSGSQR